MPVTLTDEQVARLRKDIDEMNAIFSDEARGDWWDGDDAARAIAYYVDDILTKAGCGAVISDE